MNIELIGWGAIIFSALVMALILLPDRKWVNNSSTTKNHNGRRRDQWEQ
jgi:hypothetical protein